MSRRPRMRDREVRLGADGPRDTETRSEEVAALCLPEGECPPSPGSSDGRGGKGQRAEKKHGATRSPPGTGKARPREILPSQLQEKCAGHRNAD